MEADPGVPLPVADGIPTLERALRMERAAEVRRVEPGRVVVLRQAAEAYGVQLGLARGAIARAEELHRLAPSLDRAFPLTRLTVRPDEVGDTSQEVAILPPVLIEIKDRAQLGAADALVLSSAFYHVVEQPRWLVNAPSWRDYLLPPLKTVAKAPAIPPAPLLPATSDEQSVWQEAVRRGYVAGEEQAVAIVRAGLSRLTRDVVGMVTYHTLLRQGMVTLPIQSRSDSAVGIGADGKSMAVHTRTYRIAIRPGFQGDPARWRALVGPAAGGVQ